MKKNILLGVVALVLYGLAQLQELPFFGEPSGTDVQSSGVSVQDAFKNNQSDLQIQGQGVVKKVLPDDRKGLKHQKFILRTRSGPTVLVAHNIDLAHRLPRLKKGDTVDFYGEYEWTSQGGVIHWTHHDPSGRHTDGWLKYNGKIYR